MYRHNKKCRDYASFMRPNPLLVNWKWTNRRKSKIETTNTQIPLTFWLRRQGTVASICILGLFRQGGIFWDSSDRVVYFGTLQTEWYILGLFRQGGIFWDSSDRVVYFGTLHGTHHCVNRAYLSYYWRRMNV
jgi:hypothetical protein